MVGAGDQLSTEALRLRALRKARGNADAQALLDESGGDATKARTSMMGYTLAYVAEEMPELYAALKEDPKRPDAHAALVERVGLGVLLEFLVGGAAHEEVAHLLRREVVDLRADAVVPSVRDHDAPRAALVVDRDIEVGAQRVGDLVGLLVVFCLLRLAALLEQRHGAAYLLTE